jgi:hypothetical protein
MSVLLTYRYDIKGAAGATLSPSHSRTYVLLSIGKYRKGGGNETTEAGGGKPEMGPGGIYYCTGYGQASEERREVIWW